MADWTAFTAITGVVLVLLLVLSQLTESAFSDADGESDARTRSEPSARDDPTTPASRNDALEAGGDEQPPATATGADGDRGSVRVGERNRKPTLETRPARDEIEPASLSTGAILANVAASQGLFALVLLGAVIYTGIPADALGIEFSLDYLETGLLVGTVAGVVLYVANELGAALATRVGFDHDEQLRELLAPDSLRGWLVLLLAVLPIIAVFEELLFRAALIGAVEAGFGVSPWLLAALSSVAFAVGHGMQGSVGIVVTGALGFVLAAVFIVTGSFLVVVVAHYLINALEFAVHEGLDLEWAERLEA